MHYWLGLVDLENDVTYVKSNDTDVFTIMLGSYEKLNGLTLLIARSNEKWINLTREYEWLGAGKVKAVTGFHCFSNCDTDEKFTGKSKDSWTKSFLNIDSIFKAFQFILRHFNTEIMHSLEVSLLKYIVKST